MIIPTGVKWFDIKPIEQQGFVQRIARDKEVAYKKEAEELLNKECQAYRKSLESGSKKAEFSWIYSSIKTGTLADKLSAHTLLIQDSPIHNLESIRALVQVSQSSGKREYLMALVQFKEVCLAELLPPRKLRKFGELVACLPDAPKERSIHLIVSYFEDQLKHYYCQFIEAVAKMSQDPTSQAKNKSINAIYEMLSSNGEQEQFLLEQLTNKLGDPDGKTASLAVYLLKKLMVVDHPAMKEVIVKEVERVMFRPNVKERAQFYCLCFLQEVVFTQEDSDLADKLIDIYFAFFKKCIREGDVNNKVMKGILIGLSRGLPFSSIGKSVMREHLETFYKMIHLVNNNIAIQILCLLFQVVSLESHHIEKKALKMENKSKKGKNRETSKDLVKKNTIDKQASSQQLDEAKREVTRLKDRFYSALYRFVLKKDVFETTSRPAMLFNLLYRSLKSDGEHERIFAFVKRLLQICCCTSPQYCASILFLISRILSTNAEVACLFEENLEKKGKPKKEDRDLRSKARSLDGDTRNGNSNESKGISRYLLNGRNPLFAYADKTSSWEMGFLSKHYHPSIVIFAKNLKQTQEIQYDGDILEDFSTKHFLDRFVHRTPKKVDKKDTLVAKQASLFGRLKNRKSNQLAQKELMTLPESQIPVEERFIHKFLLTKNTLRPPKDEDDIESVISDEFDELLDRFENDFDDDGFEVEEAFKKKKKITFDKDEEDLEEEQEESDWEDDASLDDEESDFDEDAYMEEMASELDEQPESDKGQKVVKEKQRKSTSDLFAFAEEFSHLLQADEEDYCESDRKGKKRKSRQDDSSESGKAHLSKTGTTKKPRIRGFNSKRGRK